MHRCSCHRIWALLPSSNVQTSHSNCHQPSSKLVHRLRLHLHSSTSSRSFASPLCIPLCVCPHISPLSFSSKHSFSTKPLAQAARYFFCTNTCCTSCNHCSHKVDQCDWRVWVWILQPSSWAFSGSKWLITAELVESRGSEAHLDGEHKGISLRIVSHWSDLPLASVPSYLLNISHGMGTLLFWILSVRLSSGLRYSLNLLSVACTSLVGLFWPFKDLWSFYRLLTFYPQSSLVERMFLLRLVPVSCFPNPLLAFSFALRFLLPSFHPTKQLCPSSFRMQLQASL